MTHDRENTTDQEKREFAELIEQSSLGTKGARQLRDRFSDDEATALIREARRRRRIEAAQSVAKPTETEDKRSKDEFPSAPTRTPDDSESLPVKEVIPHLVPGRKRSQLPLLMVISMAGSLAVSTLMLFGTGDGVAGVASVFLAVSWGALATVGLVVARPKRIQLAKLLALIVDGASPGRGVVPMEKESRSRPVHH